MSTRLVHPVSPDVWVDVKWPIRAGDLALLRNADPAGLLSCVVRWSFPDPVNPQTLYALPPDVFGWLVTRILQVDPNHAVARRRLWQVR